MPPQFALADDRQLERLLVARSLLVVAEVEEPRRLAVDQLGTEAKNWKKA